MNFSQIIERLARLPRVQRLAGYGGLYVLLALLYFFIFYMPVSDEIDTLKTEQVSLEQKKAAVQDRVKNKAAADQRFAELNNALTQALKELPNDREIPGLLKGISALGKKVGLEVKKFQPMPEQKRDYVAEVPVALEVEGAYHEVAMFFDRLSKMNRIIYVQDVEMTTPEERGGKVYLKVTGTAVTFRFLTEAEIEAERSKDKKAKGKAKAKAGGDE